MIFGVGAALEEEMTLDPRFGYFVNHDLAEYHVPVHADVPDVDAIFLPELDDQVQPAEIQGHRRTRNLRRRRVDRQRDLQRMRRADPGLSDHAGQGSVLLVERPYALTAIGHFVPALIAVGIATA